MKSSIPTVSDYMSRGAHTIGAGQTLAEAERRMREFGVRHLPVLEGGTLVGILSDRDVHLVESLPGVDPAALRVSEAMTADPYSVQSNAPLDQVARHMAKNRYGSAVVLEGTEVVGMFTTTDALRALAEYICRCAT